MCAQYPQNSNLPFPASWPCTLVDPEEWLLQVRRCLSQVRFPANLLHFVKFFSIIHKKLLLVSVFIQKCGIYRWPVAVSFSSCVWSRSYSTKKRVAYFSTNPQVCVHARAEHLTQTVVLPLARPTVDVHVLLSELDVILRWFTVLQTRQLYHLSGIQQQQAEFSHRPFYQVQGPRRNAIYSAFCSPHTIRSQMNRVFPQPKAILHRKRPGSSKWNWQQIHSEALPYKPRWPWGYPWSWSAADVGPS